MSEGKPHQRRFKAEVKATDAVIIKEFIRQVNATGKGHWFKEGGFVARYNNGTVLAFVFPKPNTNDNIKISGTNGEVISKINKFCG